MCSRYKLEEALIEKDDIADTLQRKVCGLQAEMRMIVKENSELSHQLAQLNQRITNQLSHSPHSIHQAPINISRGIDNTNKSNKCQHCTTELQSNTVCGTNYLAFNLTMENYFINSFNLLIL